MARGGHIEEVENNVIVNGDMVVVQTMEKGLGVPAIRIRRLGL